MKWTEEDKKALLAFKENVDCDDTRFKELIKEKLLDNRFIIHVLHNKELEDSDAEIDDYFGDNIRPYFLIPETQSSTKSFICYEVSFNTEAKHNNLVKYGQIIFYILCNEKDNIDQETGIARHDLLSALILDEFNWTNIFGMQIHCVSDKPSVTDNHYATRTLVFQGEFLNSIAKTKDGKTRVVNQDVIR